MTNRTVNGTAIQAAVDASAATGDQIWVNNVGGYKGYDVPATKDILIRASNSPFRVEAPANPTGNGNCIQMKGKSTLIGADSSGAFGQHGAALSITGPDARVEDYVGHHSERGYAIRVYGPASLRPRIIRAEGHHVAAMLHVDGGGAGGIMESPYSHDIDKMLVNDPAPGSDTGGMSFAFKRNNGLFTVRDARSERAYSTLQPVIDPNEPPSNDYGVDGAHIELYESAGGVLFEVTAPGLGYFMGSPIIVETGKGATGIDCKNFTIRGYETWGQWPGEPPTVTEFGKTYSKANGGFLLRTAVDFLIEKCKFRNIDHHLFLLEQTGNFATNAVIDRIVVQDNEAWLKTGDHRFLTIGSGVTPTASMFTEQRNKVYTVAGSTVVSVAGRGKTNSLPTYQSWAPAGATWGKDDYWGPEVVVPSDPCAVVTAERDAAIASLNATLNQLVVANTALATANTALTAANAALATANGSIATLTTQRDAATAKLAQAKALAGQITAL